MKRILNVAIFIMDNYFTYRKFLSATFFTIFLSGLFITAQAQETTLNGSGASNGQLRIRVYSGGRYRVDRRIGGNWETQMFDDNTGYQHLLAMKIGAQLYVVRNNRIAGSNASGDLTYTPRTTFTVTNPGPNVTTGNVQRFTRRFSSTYSGQPFSVTLEGIYDKSTPDLLVFKATVDVSQITGNPDIRLAYGFDSYVNANDRGYAYILPDYSGWNNSSPVTDRYLPVADIQQLRLVASRNNTSPGAIIGFVKMDRNFDRAYSANPYGTAAPYNLINLAGSGYKFQFGPYSGGEDNGVGVGFDLIPPGQVTQFDTGLTFSGAMAGDLNFYWNSAAGTNLTVPVNTGASLKLVYHNMNTTATSGIAVTANLPAPLTTAGGCTTTGLTSVNQDCNNNSVSYRLINATAPASSTNNIITIPVNTGIAGLYTINNASFTGAAEMIVSGNPATLTVTTEAAFANTTDVELCGGNKEYNCRVKFRGAETAAENVVINLAYGGATGDFQTRPTTVTIPAGQNYVDFTVKSAANPAGASPMTITLSSTNKAFALVSSTASTVKISVAPCYIHVNPHLRGKFY